MVFPVKMTIVDRGLERVIIEKLTRFLVLASPLDLLESAWGSVATIVLLILSNVRGKMKWI